MKNVKILFFAIILALAFVACDKGKGTEDTLYLIKETFESDDFGYGIIEYKYNEKNQLIEIHDEFTTEDYEDNFLIELRYNDDGTISEQIFDDGEFEQKAVLSYGSSVIEINMFAKEEDQDWVTQDYKQMWKFDNDYIVKDEYHYQIGEKWRISDNEQYIWTHDNITETSNYEANYLKKASRSINRFSILRMKSSHLKSTNSNLNYTVKAEYDSKNNPLTAASAIFGAKTMSKNNPLKETYVGEFNDDVYTYTYEYNAQNYPTKAIRTDKEGNTMTTIYEYK